MYNCVDAVYHASKRETFGLVRAECQLAGIPFKDVGNSSDTDLQILEKEEILDKWKRLMKL